MLAHFDHAGDVETDHRAAGRFAQRTLTVYSKAFTLEQRRGLASHLSAAQLTPTGATAHAAAGKCAACELLRQQLPSELREAGLCGSPKRRPTKGAAASEQSGGEHSARVSRFATVCLAPWRLPWPRMPRWSITLDVLSCNRRASHLVDRAAGCAQCLSHPPGTPLEAWRPCGLMQQAGTATWRGMLLV